MKRFAPDSTASDRPFIGEGETMTKLVWKRVATWDLSPEWQILWKSSTVERDYLIARRGRADHAEWELYFRQPDGTEELFTTGNMLRTIKHAAQFEHDRLARMAAHSLT
jgi:hypothetical protein